MVPMVRLWYQSWLCGRTGATGTCTSLQYTPKHQEHQHPAQAHMSVPSNWLSLAPTGSRPKPSARNSRPAVKPARHPTRHPTFHSSSIQGGTYPLGGCITSGMDVCPGSGPTMLGQTVGGGRGSTTGSPNIIPTGRPPAPAPPAEGMRGESGRPLTLCAIMRARRLMGAGPGAAATHPRQPAARQHQPNEYTCQEQQVYWTPALAAHLHRHPLLGLGSSLRHPWLREELRR